MANSEGTNDGYQPDWGQPWEEAGDYGDPAGGFDADSNSENDVTRAREELADLTAEVAAMGTQDAVTGSEDPIEAYNADPNRSGDFAYENGELVLRPYPKPPKQPRESSSDRAESAPGSFTIQHGRTPGGQSKYSVTITPGPNAGDTFIQKDAVVLGADGEPLNDDNLPPGVHRIGKRAVIKTTYNADGTRKTEVSEPGSFLRRIFKRRSDGEPQDS
jgi:hypothetical protein